MDNNVINNLINAVAAYAEEGAWNDSDMIDALVEMGVTQEDFIRCGKGDFVKAYFAEEEVAELKPTSTLPREQIQQYLRGQGHPQPDVDGTLDDFMFGGERQAYFDEAVLNNYDLPDVDRWFHLMDVLDVKLSYKTAMEISNALWEADLETMELNLPEERLGLDAYGRGVFKGSYEKVKEQVLAEVVQKEGFSAGDLCKIQAPGLTLDDAFQLYAELRFQADGLRTLLFGNRDEVWDISGAENERLLPYELDQVVEPYLMKDSPLDQFIEQEVPFRLSEILGLELSHEQIADIVEAVKDHNDVMFDYDQFDEFLAEQYEEIAGLDSNRIKSIQGEICNLRHELEGALEFQPDMVPVIDRRLCELQDELDAIYGVKPKNLKLKMFVFDDNLILSDNNETVNGYLWAVDSLVKRLPEPQDLENIDFYVEYNVVSGSVVLSATYDTPSADGELNKYFEVELSDDEKLDLIATLEQYCQDTYGQSLLEFANEFRTKSGMEPVQPSVVHAALEDQIQVAAHAKQEQGTETVEPRRTFER